MEEQRLAVQRMQDYIAQHLKETITLADLARVSLYSPWYAYRLFAQWTNLTPADYIRRLRLSQSALRLRDERVRIIDAAFAAGFGSVDGYQRAFYREFGLNPREYAAHPVPIYLFTPYGVKYKSVGEEPKEMDKVKTVFVQIVERPVCRVIIKRGISADNYFDYCQEVGCDVWGLLRSIRSLDGEPVCLWLPKAYQKPGTSSYVQGVCVPLESESPIPADFDVITLPATKYLMLQGEPFAEEDYCQAIEEIWAARERFDPRPTGYEWDEEKPRIQLEPIGTRGYIELYPVKKST